MAKFYRCGESALQGRESVEPNCHLNRQCATKKIICGVGRMGVFPLRSKASFTSLINSLILYLLGLEYKDYHCAFGFW